MKTKTNFFKLFLCFVAFAIFSILFAFAPSLTTFAAETNPANITNYLYTFSMTNMPDKDIDVSKGQEFLIPLIKSEADWATSYKIIVKDASGQEHVYNNAGEYDEEYFVSPSDGSQDYIKVNTTKAGKYDIYYELTGDFGTVKSNTYTVTLKNVAYEINFSIFSENEDTGLNALIPSQVKIGQTYTLPTAYAVATDSDVVTNDRVATLKVSNSNGETVELDDNVLPTSEKETYTIEYSYVGGTNNPTVSYTIEVVSEEDYDAPTETRILSPTFPSIELGQTDIELPRVPVNEKYSNTTKNNVDYNILSITIQKEGSDTIKKVLNNNDLTFNMTKEEFGVESYDDLKGNYIITYEIQTAYNTITKKYRITNVEYVTSPEVYMAYNYDEGATDVNTNYAVDLKSTYGYNEIILPAIYATDMVSSSEDLLVVRYLESSDHKIFYVDNKVIDGGELVDVDDAYLESHPTVSANMVSADELVGPNGAQVFRFVSSTEEDYEEKSADYAGKYTLHYMVYSKISKKEKDLTYKIQISADAIANITESTPTISFNNFNKKTISHSDEFEISVNATDEQDTRLKTAMFYFYGSDVSNLETKISSAIASVESASTEEIGLRYNVLDNPKFISSMGVDYTGFKALSVSEDSANKFNFTLAGRDYEGQTNVTIVAIAINDNGTTSYVTKTLTLKDTIEDNDAPTATIVDLGSFTTSDNTIITLENVNQFDTITLPSIAFEDIDKSLSVSVMYYVIDSNGNVSGYKYPSNYVLTGNSANGGTIVASQAGTYVVVYTATDDAGNTTTLFANFDAKVNADPIFEVEAIGDDITTSGNTVTIEQGGTIDFYPTVYSSDRTSDETENYKDDISINVTNNGNQYEPSGNEEYSYKFLDAGNYVLTFTLKFGEAEDDVLTQVIYVNVTSVQLKWNDEISVQSTAVAGDTIDLGYPTASQGEEKATISVIITTPGEKTENAVLANDKWTYTVPTTGNNINGTYTVTYTATTSDSTITMTKTFRVGDLEKPTISLNVSEDKLKQNIVYNGSNIIYSIKVVKTPSSERSVVITVTNGDKQLYSYEILSGSTALQDNKASQTTLWNNLSVVLTTSNGTMTSETDGNTTNYTITGTGEYTLTISTYDGTTESSSNPATKPLTFSVKSESVVDEEDDNVVGVVLIVLSLLVLAGVILFFAFTGKGGNNKKTTSKGNKSKSTKKVKDKESVESAEEKTEEVESVEEKTEENKTEVKEGEVE